MAKKALKPVKSKPSAVRAVVSTAHFKRALEAGEGILRLAPTWVPRSFLMPGRRIKLAPQDLYALGAHRGGIDERWFASTTAAANEGAPPDEGLSYVVGRGQACVHASRCGGVGRGQAGRQGHLGPFSALAGLQQVLRQHGPDPPSHAPEQRPGGPRRPAGQARIVLLSPAAQRHRQQLPIHVLWPGAGHDQGRHPPLPRTLECRR